LRYFWLRPIPIWRTIRTTSSRRARQHEVSLPRRRALLDLAIVYDPRVLDFVAPEQLGERVVVTDFDEIFIAFQHELDLAVALGAVPDEVGYLFGDGELGKPVEDLDNVLSLETDRNGGLERMLCEFILVDVGRARHRFGDGDEEVLGLSGEGMKSFENDSVIYGRNVKWTRCGVGFQREKAEVCAREEGRDEIGRESTKGHGCACALVVGVLLGHLELEFEPRCCRRRLYLGAPATSRPRRSGTIRLVGIVILVFRLVRAVRKVEILVVLVRARDRFRCGLRVRRRPRTFGRTGVV
jgi:hypothetical protein